MMKRILLCVLLCVIQASAIAEVFKLGLPKKHAIFDEDAFTRVRCAFALAGHEVKFIELPTERSLRMAVRGQIDGDFGRIEQVFLDYPDSLVKVDEAIMDIELWAFGRPGLSATSFPELRPYALVSMLGVRFFDHLEKEGYLTVGRSPSVYGAITMIEAGRGDYTVWVRNKTVDQLLKNSKGRVIPVFNKPFAKKKIYLGLHIRHLEYVDHIRLALQDEKCRYKSSDLSARD